MAPSVDGMPDIVPAPSSDSKSNSLGSGTTHRQLPAKRNRIQLSCSQCRHAKLKCDRNDPCSQCTRKGRSSQCSFPPPVTRKKPAVSLQNRLKHLESLVKGAMVGQTTESSVMSSANFSNGLEAQDFSRTQDEDYGAVPSAKTPKQSSGQVLQGANETTYVGATHWAAILDDIEEIKSYFTDDGRGADLDEGVTPDTSLLFSSQSTTTREELLGALPPRNVVDRLVHRYFNFSTPAVHIIHRPIFQKEYKRFWADPTTTPLSWLAQLFGMMVLAASAFLVTGETLPDTRGTPMEMIRSYRLCCAQSLVLSKYTQPGPYTIEALLIYMEGEFFSTKEVQVNAFLLVGTAIRLALRMGLHRDATRVRGNFTPCQAELRRRLWHILSQIDMLAGFHLGLPSMVHAIESDTQYPRNLRDEDFGEDTIELPAARPETEMTPMSYTIAKGRVCDVFGKIAFQANQLSLPSYEEVMNLDSLLNDAFGKVPQFLQVIPLELAVTDSSEIIMQRFNIDLLYQKSRCVLHRRYLTHGDEKLQSTYSKQTVMDASMRLLQLQSAIHEAVQPDGPLSRDTWYISSLSMHDFLLAAAIIYLQIIQAIKDSAQTKEVFHTFELKHGVKIKALERSFTNWNQTRALSIDAKKASDVLHFMLEKVKSALDDTFGHKSPPLFAAVNTLGSGTDLISGLSLGESIPANAAPPAASTFDIWSYQAYDTTPSSGIGMQRDLDLFNLPTEPLGAMLDMETDFDWDVFDNHLRPQQVFNQTWPDPAFRDFGFETGDDYYSL